MVVFFLGMALLNLEPDLTRRSIAGVLLIAAFCAVVVLTWGDPDGEVRGWRETLFSRYTLLWLGVLVLLAVAIAAASYQQQQCPRCYPQPYWKAHAAGAPRPLR
jgi:small-conductance mechanosensitive channel